MFQQSLPLYTPRYRIPMEYVTSVPDMILCEQTSTGSNWSSHGGVDHPSFDRLRKHLASKGLIYMQVAWNNGDRVLEPFYLNDVLFEEGDQFPCASAMDHKLERSEKHPLVKAPEEPAGPELQDWEVFKSYYGTMHVRGLVFNNPLFPDGELIYTSEIKNFEKDYVITQNTRYKLV